MTLRGSHGRCNTDFLTGFAFYRCNQSGVAYVAFSQWISVIIIYTFVYHMLEPPEEYYELVLSDGDDASPAALKRALEADCEAQPSVTSAEWPNVEESITEESQAPLLARVFRYPSLRAQQVSLLGKLPALLLFPCFAFGIQEAIWLIIPSSREKRRFYGW